MEKIVLVSQSFIVLSEIVIQTISVGSLAEHVKPNAKWNRNWLHASLCLFYDMSFSFLKKNTCSFCWRRYPLHQCVRNIRYLYNVPLPLLFFQLAQKEKSFPDSFFPLYWKFYTIYFDSFVLPHITAVR